jgi:hypothetical protein
MTIAEELIAELTRARTKFPGRRFRLPALVEEVGELAEAILANDADAIRREAIQVAATAIRIAEEGDATTYQPMGFAGLVSALGNVSRYLMQRNKLRALRALEDASNHIYVVRAGEDPTFDDATDEEAQP